MRELFALHHQHGNVVLASGAIGGGDQFVHRGLRIAGMALHGGADFRRGHLVAEAIAAQEQRAFGIERNAGDFDEIGVVGRVLLAAHVAKDLIAARVAHGVRLAQFATVFALADRGMIVRDLADFAAAHLVETRIAHVSHHGRAVFQHGEGEHARHAGEFGVGARLAQNFVVGHGDGLADALLDGAGLALEARAHARARRFPPPSRPRPARRCRPPRGRCRAPRRCGTRPRCCCARGRGRWPPRT